MRIEITQAPPDDTYFTVNSIAPRVEWGRIALTQGTGTRRSWGAPSVSNVVIVNAPQFAAIHCSYWHKHAQGQLWRFFELHNGIVQLNWSELDHNQQVLTLANLGHAPAWASAPGRVSERRQTMERKFYPIDLEYIGGSRSGIAGHLQHRIRILAKPGLTNQSREPRIEGWLGCTDDWDERALGELNEQQARALLLAHGVQLPDGVPVRYTDYSIEHRDSEWYNRTFAYSESE